MQDNHYLILEYLYGKTGGVMEKDFPDSIKAEFSVRTFDPGGFHHEIQVVLKTHKKWITIIPGKPGYVLTPDGREAFEKEKKRRAGEDTVYQMQIDKLKGEIDDLNNRLSDRRPNNLRANIAIGISIAVIIMEILKLIFKE